MVTIPTSSDDSCGDGNDEGENANDDLAGRLGGEILRARLGQHRH